MRRTALGGRSPLLRRPSLVTVLLVVLGLAGLVVRFELGGIGLPVPPTEPTLRVLTALAATLTVGGVLNHVLVQGRDLPLSVTESTVTAAADTVETLVAARDLPDERVYVPSTGDRGPQLVVPVSDEDVLAAAGRTVDDADTDGVAVTPSAAGLVARFDGQGVDAVADSPAERLDALCDALTAVYELAGGATPTVEGGHATIAVRACPIGQPRRVDHPVSSFLATGLAEALDRPVEVTAVRPDEGNRAYAFEVSLRWAAAEGQ